MSNVSKIKNIAKRLKAIQEELSDLGTAVSADAKLDGLDIPHQIEETESCVDDATSFLTEALETIADEEVGDENEDDEEP